MHLTNYAVNKDSLNYRRGEHNYQIGSKRSFEYLLRYLSSSNRSVSG